MINTNETILCNLQLCNKGEELTCNVFRWRNRTYTSIETRLVSFVKLHIIAKKHINMAYWDLIGHLGLDKGLAIRSNFIRVNLNVEPLNKYPVDTLHRFFRFMAGFAHQHKVKIFMIPCCFYLSLCAIQVLLGFWLSILFIIYTHIIKFEKLTMW